MQIQVRGVPSSSSKPALYNGNPSRHSVKSWMSLKARYTIGESNTAPFKRLPVLMFLQNLTLLQSASKNRDKNMRLMPRMKQILDDREHRYGAGKICAVLQKPANKSAQNVFRPLCRSCRASPQMQKNSTVSCSSAKGEICCSGRVLLCNIQKGTSISTGIHFRTTLPKVCRRIYPVLQSGPAPSNAG